MCKLYSTAYYKGVGRERHGNLHLLKLNCPKTTNQKGEITMSERDYSKQVARRQRIGSRTLVVVVDIGCASNAIGFMSKEGRCWEVILTC